MLSAIIFAALLLGAVFSAGYYDYWLHRSRFVARVFEQGPTTYVVLMMFAIFGTWVFYGIMRYNIWYERKQDIELEPIA